MGRVDLLLIVDGLLIYLLSMTNENPIPHLTAFMGGCLWVLGMTDYWKNRIKLKRMENKDEQ